MTSIGNRITYVRLSCLTGTVRRAGKPDLLSCRSHRSVCLLSPEPLGSAIPPCLESPHPEIPTMNPDPQPWPRVTTYSYDNAGRVTGIGDQTGQDRGLAAAAS